MTPISFESEEERLRDFSRAKFCANTSGQFAAGNAFYSMRLKTPKSCTMFSWCLRSTSRVSPHKDDIAAAGHTDSPPYDLCQCPGFRMHWNMNVAILWTWMLWLSTSLEHERYSGSGMAAILEHLALCGKMRQVRGGRFGQYDFNVRLYMRVEGSTRPRPQSCTT